MNVKFSYYVSFFAVIALVLLAFLGAKAGLAGQWLFGVVIPYLAAITFFIGLVNRVVKWGRIPVPFRIPTTCAQEKTLPWIKRSLGDKLDNPENTLQVVGRMMLEVLTFRSLFRSTKTELREGPKLVYWSAKWLWLAALAFHYSFLTVLVRHLRLVTEPVPSPVNLIASVDGFFQITVPALQMSGIVLLAAATYLLIRRLVIPQVRYISLPADYFPLFLIMGIAISGILMRYFYKVDMVSVKELTMGLASLHPTVPEGIGVMFYIHVFLVSILFAYFPFSKLVHMAGVFLSPTRNLPNDNRAKRHVNPWDYPVKVHTYQEYEDDFRKKMKAAGIPVEKE